ncbi:UDP-N-acetylmuramoyl-L-alanine--D-glutamate ligase [Clostridium manihotivorum]|uniref:UDP-N-acetylmuramoylalanine--D-glutamate ligase n=1 Tax=Clostridium manihotivorum TaxID=2320868 RepID=A0A3R5U3M1_9CLOT|nr:UDP-N-acetylmuramoyl-L-alanine--D-glutamate ligase [Clostridium manihotivorum]QAA30756.1 UDP-N-acetylmuramoyl-L-alanine--D-glutamate ligase [Clostridium manihotivorum]
MRKDFSEFKSFIRGKNTAVIGIGVSNIPLIDFLLDLGANVKAFDKKNREQLNKIADYFEKKGVELYLGDKYLDQLEGFEVIFKSPSMRIDHEALVKAKSEGAYITSEIEEFVRYCKGKIYAVTGSDGKTTTTTVISKLLSEEGFKTWIGGNIGIPLFSKIEEISEEDKVVLELSSFQLMTMNSQVDVAVVTNITPNHLDMHKDMDEYIESKKNIFKYQDNSDLLVINTENDITAGFRNEAIGKVREFSSKRKLEDGAYFEDGSLYILGKEVCKKNDIVIKGMHNVENYLAAFAATYEEVSIQSMKAVATTFGGVEHRSEFVRELDGVKYYNDSIGSSPTRTIATIKAFDKPVILIAGGYDKKIPFEPLAYEGNKYIKELILLGATKEKIKHVFDKLSTEKGISIPMHMVDSLDEAVFKARDLAKTEDIVILSPACASFDMFANFEIRGNKFKDIVSGL